VSVALTIITEVLVMVIVAPPGMVLMKVVRLLKVVGAMTLGLVEGEAPITVAEVTIDAVVCPFGIVLISVVRTVETERKDEVGIVLEGCAGSDKIDTKEVDGDGNMTEVGVTYCGVVVDPGREMGMLPDGVVGESDEMTGVIPGVFVTRVLN
jgi:hypothetical protein